MASLKLAGVRAILAPDCRGRRGLTQALGGWIKMPRPWAFAFAALAIGCAAHRPTEQLCIPAIGDEAHRATRVDPRDLPISELLSLARLSPQEQDICWYRNMSTGHIELIQWYGGKSVTFSNSTGSWRVTEVRDVVIH